MTGMRWFALLLVACSAPSEPATKAQPHIAEPRATTRPIIDSHVHLAFYPVADQLAAHGIGGAVDLASPESSLGAPYPFPVIQAGPMLTHPGGYPLDAWGPNGYGIGCDQEACVVDAIDRLKKEGARVIKIALDDDGLDPTLAKQAVWYAHRIGLKVAVHALTDAGARLAADIHADVLAHTPVEPLSEQTIAAWKQEERSREALDGTTAPGKTPVAVISTLAAFGGSPSAVKNLRALRAADLVVLYGTDLGNLRVDGPSTDEIELMKSSGMTDEDVHSAMTTVPWQFWGFDELKTR